MYQLSTRTPAICVVAPVFDIPMAGLDIGAPQTAVVADTDPVAAVDLRPMLPGTDIMPRPVQVEPFVALADVPAAGAGTARAQRLPRIAARRNRRAAVHTGCARPTALARCRLTALSDSGAHGCGNVVLRARKPVVAGGAR
jgi:hypothetical protein